MGTMKPNHLITPSWYGAPKLRRSLGQKLPRAQADLPTASAGSAGFQGAPGGLGAKKRKDAKNTCRAHKLIGLDDVC